MKYKCADENRDAGIRLFYDAILKKSLKDNRSYKESKEMAIDAVQNRYTLSRKRIKAIVNQQAKANATSLLPSMMFQNESLIEGLRAENVFLQEKIQQNEKLIGLIEDVCYTVRRNR